jgi:DNA-binding PadR family transcriptional regulator
VTRSSQTDLAVLAVLSVGPLTGYAVREAVTTHLGAFWSESFGQIYPALARLRSDGLVATDAGDRDGSSVHRLTAAGREHLVELMRQEPVAAPPRNGILLRLFFGDVLGVEACRALVVESRAAAEARLDALAVARAEAEADDPTHRPYRLITISAGEHSARAAIAWADETLAALDALARG